MYLGVGGVGEAVSDNLSKSALSFRHMCPGNQIRVIERGSKQLCFLKHLASYILCASFPALHVSDVMRYRLLQV